MGEPETRKIHFIHLIWRTKIAKFDGEFFSSNSSKIAEIPPVNSGHGRLQNKTALRHGRFELTLAVNTALWFAYVYAYAYVAYVYNAGISPFIVEAYIDS